MSKLRKIANWVVSKFAKFVNEQMEIPDIPNFIPLAAGLFRDEICILRNQALRFLSNLLVRWSPLTREIRLWPIAVHDEAQL
jgi:hypothetical protein